MPTTGTGLFPASKRIFYEKAPLVEVICQLRFPPILRIESEIPSAFQEQIRQTFPLFERTVSPAAGQIPEEILRLVAPQMGASFRFTTEDGSSAAVLNPQFISLTTTKYREWHHFRNQLEGPLSALVEIYKPSFFSRIGLRYRDAIDRSKIGLAEEPWSALLRSEVLGELAIPEFESNLEEAKRIIRVRLTDGPGSVLLQHGLGLVEGSNQPAYVIDFDFFTEEKTGVQDAGPILNNFNNLAGRAFRWSISPKLHAALGPREFEH